MSRGWAVRRFVLLIVFVQGLTTVALFSWCSLQSGARLFRSNHVYILFLFTYLYKLCGVCIYVRAVCIWVCTCVSCMFLVFLRLLRGKRIITTSTTKTAAATTWIINLSKNGCQPATLIRLHHQPTYLTNMRDKDQIYYPTQGGESHKWS